jgi:hypothetical protein
VAREWDGSLIQWGLKMRKLVRLSAILAAVAIASPAHASSIVFSYSGYVSSDVLAWPTGPHFGPIPIYLPFGSDNLTGQAFSITETFNLTNAFFSGGSYFAGGNTFPFGSAQITIAGVSEPYIAPLGGFTPTPGGFYSSLATRGAIGSIYPFSHLDYSSTFTPNGTVVNASLNVSDDQSFLWSRTLDFKVTSETFAVSPVPLPPALPLFVVALLALGIFGYVRRAKDVTPAHGQAY